MGLLCVGGLFAFACFTPTTFLFRSVELTVHGNEPSQSMASDTDRAIVQMLIKAAKRGQRLKANASISSSGTHANGQDTASSGKRESLVLLHNDDLKRLSTEESISWDKPAYAGLDADSLKEDIISDLTEAELEEGAYYYFYYPKDIVAFPLSIYLTEEESQDA